MSDRGRSARLVVLSLVLSLVLSMVIALVLVSCSSPGSDAVQSLTDSGPALALLDGGRELVKVGEADGVVSLAVVRIGGDRVVLDVKEPDQPTASASVTSGQTLPLGGRAARLGIRPPRSDYDRTWVTFELTSGTPDVTPTAAEPTGSAGQPRTVQQGTQAPLQLGGQSVVVGIVSSGPAAVVFGFSAPTDSGTHHLVSGDFTTIAGQVVRVEGTGDSVIFTPYG